MKRLSKIVICSILILTVLSVTIMANIILAETNVDNETFYVGVTYGGDTVEGAKQLIDKVKDYTTLFILQSGPLAANSEAINEIGDYACAANLKYAIMGSTKSSHECGINNRSLEAKARWGEQFIGIYYMDEPGGNILDNGATDIQALTTVNNVTTAITKTTDGAIKVSEFYGDYLSMHTNVSTYFPDGKITIQKYYSEEIFEQGSNSLSEENKPLVGTIFGSFRELTVKINYYPNGTITIEERIDEGIIEGDDTNTTYIGVKSDINFYAPENITKCLYEIRSYEAILKQHPIQTIDDAAKFFVNSNKYRLELINKEQLQEEAILVFTSDYSLYWWDYQSGYDLVLAQLGWNNSITQEIGLVRGAANLQDKSWGTILTWKYTHAPFLTDGEEMFEQMKTSYEAGAKYVIIFNYSEDPTNPNTLQEEHFDALERFWVEVVENPQVIPGSIKAEAVLVLPINYGWGMRNPQDRIWGIWDADDMSQRIWDEVQSRLAQYGSKLDIVYDDPAYPVAGRYNNIHYITNVFPYVWIIAAILLLPITAGILLFYFKRRKNKTTKQATLVL